MSTPIRPLDFVRGKQAQHKKVFIILLNWNNWTDTRECLESLEKTDYKGFEVIIVDNASSEKERGEIRNFYTKYKEKPGGGPASLRGYILNTIYNSSNFGFAGGNNVGIKYALKHRADYVLLLNNDAVVDPNFLTELVRVGESEPYIGILGSRIYKYKTDDIVFDGGKINFWLTKGEHIVNKSEIRSTKSKTNSKFKIPAKGKARHGRQNSKFYADYITGAAMLIKREVIERIGLMRKEYFLYYEDVDWCVRAKRAGYKCVLVPKSRVWHKVSATNKEGSPSYIYYHTRNALMLAKFNGNLLQKVAVYFKGAWILAKQMLKFLFPAASTGSPQDKRLWAKAMTKGVVDFYRGKYGKY